MEHLSSCAEQQQHLEQRVQIQWRRDKVQELCSKEYSRREVSLVLQVGLAKVNTDISHLIDEARLQFLYSVKSKSIILAYIK